MDLSLEPINYEENGLRSSRNFIRPVCPCLYIHICVQAADYRPNHRRAERRIQAPQHCRSSRFYRVRPSSLVQNGANDSNDMSMTDLTIGALTALHRICESIDSISSTASSHSRAFVIEVMGRHCGWLALLAGIATGADFIFIPENPPASDDWESEMCNLLKSVSPSSSQAKGLG
jgi:hypothetical protein